MVLQAWLEGEGQHWSRELLSSVREFSGSIGGSDTMQAAVQEIANLTAEKVCVTYLDSQNCTLTVDCLSDECHCRISHSDFTNIAWNDVTLLYRTVQARRNCGVTYSHRGRVLQQDNSSRLHSSRSGNANYGSHSIRQQNQQPPGQLGQAAYY